MVSIQERVVVARVRYLVRADLVTIQMTLASFTKPLPSKLPHLKGTFCGPMEGKVCS